MADRECPWWLECARESLVTEHGVQLGPVCLWVWFGISRQGVEYVLEQDEAAWAGPTPLPRPTAGDLKVLRVVRAAGKLDSKKLPALLKVKPTTGALRTRLARLDHRLGLLRRDNGECSLTPRGLALLRMLEGD